MSEFKEGIVLSCIGGRFCVLSEHRRYSCYAKGAFRHNKEKVYSGDCVRFVPGMSVPDDGSVLPPSTENDGYITEILPRTSLLSRPPIANVDTLFIFLAAADPEPDLLYVDRLTVCALQAGIRPIVICNKADLSKERAREIVDIYTAVGIQAHAICAHSNALSERTLWESLLSGHVSAMAGFSGVGKTTFFNQLFPASQTEVGALSRKLSRGKNTTRTTQLYSLQNSALRTEGLFADTAGFSHMELEDTQRLPPEDLPFYFPEFEPLLGTCKYTKCSHTREDGCKIRQGVSDGTIPPSRHDSYLALFEELKLHKPF